MPSTGLGGHLGPTMVPGMARGDSRMQELPLHPQHTYPHRATQGWSLTFFRHKRDEAAPHLHLGRVDLAFARWCPSANNTQEVMSPTLEPILSMSPDICPAPSKQGKEGRPGRSGQEQSECLLLRALQHPCTPSPSPPPPQDSKRHPGCVCRPYSSLCYISLC